MRRRVQTSISRERACVMWQAVTGIPFHFWGGSFLFFTSLLVWACFTTKATNLLLVAHFDIVHDVQSNHHRGASHERVNAWGRDEVGQTCDETRANFVWSFSTATPTGADLHKLDRRIPKRFCVRCDTKRTKREIRGFLTLFVGMSFRLPKARKKQSTEFQYSLTFMQRVIRKKICCLW